MPLVLRPQVFRHAGQGTGTLPKMSELRRTVE